jgi:hypothetical protein
MLDIRQLREDPEEIKTRLQTREGESWRLTDSFKGDRVKRSRSQKRVANISRDFRGARKTIMTTSLREGS